MQEHYAKDVTNRLKTVRGHLDGIVRMIDADAYCVDLMKQVSAAQASLERANRVILRNHLETCFSDALLNAGDREVAITELVDAVKFSEALTGPAALHAPVAAGEAPAAA